MKIKSLKLTNVGMVAGITLPLDKSLVLLYGEIRQGKTTILNAIRYVFGGAFPSDIIRHGQAEASIELELDNGSIRREFYRASDGTTKGRPITFFRDGEQVKRPVEEIAKFLNPFLLDQDHLVRMTELERKKYFAGLFGVDLSATDREIARCEADAREIRATLRGYGDIDLTEVSAVDVSVLRQKLSGVLAAHESAMSVYVKQDEEVREHNENLQGAYDSKRSWEQEIYKLECQLSNAKAQLSNTEQFIAGNQPKMLPLCPVKPDTSALEAQISDAAANNVRAELYQKNLARDKKRQGEQAQVSELERKIKELRDSRLTRLSEISDSCGVPGLRFKEDGEFTYDGTTAGMLSTSQLMDLSSQLSALYPEGFGLDLIDRAESLGKSVFEFVKRATAENKTILATIVGERPAEVPENVGVFVVENGVLK